MDRVLASEAKGRGFDSRRARQPFTVFTGHMDNAFGVNGLPADSTPNSQSVSRFLDQHVDHITQRLGFIFACIEGFLPDRDLFVRAGAA